MIPSATHKHLFYSEMAKLLEAGFDIRKAAAVLMDTRLPTPQAVMLKDLNQGLESGQSIAAALGSDPKTFTELERSIIGAGERGGKLAPAFQHLADYFGMLASARREMVNGMIYPIIILHLGVVIGTIPMNLMQPTQTPAQMVGGLVVNLIILYVVAFVVLMAIRAVLKMAPGNAAIDGSINRIPWIGSVRKNLAMARFSQVYHSCLLAGIPMSETAGISADASQSGLIRRAGERLVQTAREGNALGPQFVAEDAFPKAFARSYMTGEEAGTLDKDLARWAKLFQDGARSSAKTMAVMVPKILYFFIMMFVAWKIVSFFTGYYSGMEQMLD
jgi:type II secretory pathway component PulF